MRPTINMNVENSTADGDRILINQFKTAQLNDIVVAEVDWHADLIIKRVVGMPGDKIEIKDEITHFALYVNDNVLYTKDKYGDNSYLNPTGSYGYYKAYLSFLDSYEFSDYVETDGENKYIKLDENEYFLMGDNWGMTLDSLSKGPIKESNILGVVDLIIDVNDKNPFTPFIFFMKKIFTFN